MEIFKQVEKLYGKRRSFIVEVFSVATKDLLRSWEIDFDKKNYETEYGKLKQFFLGTLHIRVSQQIPESLHTLPPKNLSVSVYDKEFNEEVSVSVRMK